jgi:hypothetical protein
MTRSRGMTRYAPAFAVFDRLGLALAALMLVARVIVLDAHSGPPFPIVSNHLAGLYDISIWTDPDATDDGSAQGQFWVVLAPAKGPDGANGAATIPAGTSVDVTIRATDRQAPPHTGRAAPVDGLITRQFVALRMDHEGPFSVHVLVDGPLGRAEVRSRVDATYDERPPALLLIVFAFPFVAIGVLWFRVMMRRRAAAAREPAR